MLTPEQVLARKVVDERGCWLYQGTLSVYGYGIYGLRARLVHRLAWSLTHGPIPPGMWVLHRCDVRRCFNPDHLYLGNHADNTRDMVERGRAAKGEANSKAKFTAEQVMRIRALRASGVSYHQLSRDFRVSRPALKAICTGKHWKHLPTYFTEEATR
jgi:hypothetical protein